MKTGGRQVMQIMRGRHIMALTASLALAALCALLPPAARARELHLLAGAGLRQPTDRLIKAFNKASKHKVYVDYGGSGQLMTRYLASRKGDLFMPGSLFYIDKLEERGLVSSVRLIVLHTPVLAVNRAKAGLVSGLADLARPGLRVGLGDPRAMALGRLAADILQRAGLAHKVAGNVVVRTATVKQLAFYVGQGFVDAAIIARSDAFLLRGQVKMLPISRRYFTPEFIGVALLKTSAAPEAARRLQEFLSSARARKVFQDFGFLPLSHPGQ